MFHKTMNLILAAMARIEVLVLTMGNVIEENTVGGMGVFRLIK